MWIFRSSAVLLETNKYLNHYEDTLLWPYINFGSERC